MKKGILILMITILGISASAQFVATVEIKEDIVGICDKEAVYFLLPSFTGQIAPTSPISKDQIAEKLNSEVAFLKANPKFKSKGTISVIINCKGEIVSCKLDKPTKKEELNNQIISVFKSLGTWKAGSLNGIRVDASVIYSFHIKNGKFTFDY